MHMGEGRGSSTPEQKDLSRGLGHFPKRGNILLSIVRIQNQGELQLRKRCSSIILVEATAFHKDLRAAASLRVCLVFLT